MDKPKTQAVVMSGLVPEEVLNEFAGWGLPIDVVDTVLTTPEEIVDYIREAIESRDAVEIRQTDLDVIHRFIKHQQRGRLHMTLDGEEHTSSFVVYFCKTPTGDYALPWKAEGIQEMMIDPGTYLSYTEEVGGVEVKKKVHFANSSELFFGDNKAFMICTPMEEAK